MITDLHSPEFYNKQTIPLDLLSKHFLRMMLQEMERVARNEYRTDGVFDTAWTITSPANDKLTVTPASPYLAVDGIGGTIHLHADDARIAAINFANVNTTAYDVGVQASYYPGAPATTPVTPFLEVNPETRQYEYRLFRTTIGRLGHPDSVTVNGDGSLTFVIDGILINGGVTHAGRKAKVWMVTPKTASEATAVQELTVVFSSGANKVSTTNGAAEAFGQSTPSTTITDYLVLVEGLVVVPRATRDLRSTAALTGTVSSSGKELTGSGTAFTTEVKKGDIVTNGRENRTVVKVTSNTSALVDREFLVPLSAATVTRAGVLFLGQATGTGAGTTPTVFSTLDQNVIVFSGSDISSILRRDSHGYIKLDVRADSSDSDEAQTRVRDSSGNVRHYVNEKGVEKIDQSFESAANMHLTREETTVFSGVKVREYQPGSQSATFPVPARIVTVNARWNEGDNKWYPDVAGAAASALIFGGETGTQISMQSYASAPASWTELEFQRTITLSSLAFAGRTGAFGVPTLSAQDAAFAAMGMATAGAFSIYGDGNTWNFIGQLGKSDTTYGNVRAYYNEGLHFTVNAEYDGANWDKDVNAAPSWRLSIITNGAATGTFKISFNDGGVDNFAEGAWADKLSMDEGGNLGIASNFSANGDIAAQGGDCIGDEFTHAAEVTRDVSISTHSGEYVPGVVSPADQTPDWVKDNVNFAATPLKWVNRVGTQAFMRIALTPMLNIGEKLKEIHVRCRPHTAGAGNRMSIVVAKNIIASGTVSYPMSAVYTDGTANEQDLAATGLTLVPAAGEEWYIMVSGQISDGTPTVAGSDWLGATTLKIGVAKSSR